VAKTEKVIGFTFMSGVCKINIVESAPTLKTLLGQQKTATGKERVQALYLLKTGQIETVQHLAGCLGRDRVTVQRWLGQYRQGGLKAMLTIGKSKGRPKVIPDWAVKRLKQELCDPEGFESYKEVQIWLKAVLGIEASYHAVHNLVRYKLKAKLKVARTRSFEQELDAIETFKKNCQIF
jgi:transposase